MTVNLAAQQLAEATFVDDLRRIMRETGLPPHRLILEMTETVMLHDTSTTIARLEAFRELGVRIAIDDFGTGYSSLGYLRERGPGAREVPARVSGQQAPASV